LPKIFSKLTIVDYNGGVVGHTDGLNFIYLWEFFCFFWIDH